MIGKVAVAGREMASRERAKTKSAASSRAAELEKLSSARAETEARAEETLRGQRRATSFLALNRWIDLVTRRPRQTQFH